MLGANRRTTGWPPVELPQPFETNSSFLALLQVYLYHSMRFLYPIARHFQPKYILDAGVQRRVLVPIICPVLPTTFIGSFSTDIANRIDCPYFH